MHIAAVIVGSVLVNVSQGEGVLLLDFVICPYRETLLVKVEAV